jgi:RND family efflux transporter MFP subunit
MILRLALPFMLFAGLLFAGSAMAADHACLIEPKQVLKLAASVQGVVGSVNVDRGDRVHAGQLVAQLDSAVEEANLAIAKLRATNDTEVAAGQAKLDYLRRKLARKDTLRSNTYGSAAELDEAQSDAKVAESQLRENILNLNQAKLEAIRADGLLRQRLILSPVNGVVTERTLGPGEFLNDQAHILTIAEMDPLRVETYLPISMYGHVKAGDVATVMPDDPVGGKYEAKVVVVDSVFDAASNTIGVRLELPNPDLRLPAGIHCRVHFDEGP